jgi:site-specific DNA-methyltransferase (adenine-specific)
MYSEKDDDNYDRSDRGDLIGRFPANLLVSDDALNDGIISRGDGSLSLRKNKTPNLGRNGIYGDSAVINDIGYNDSGSNSRYFSLDAWWAEQVKKLPESVQKVFPFLIVPKASTSERNDGLDDAGTGSNTYNRKCLTCGKWERNQGINPEKYTCTCEKPDWELPKGNVHPTSKPVQLMSYLITLGSREQDIVLDPFIGSGTTAISARILSRRFIGFEKDEAYFKIAEGRIKEHLLQKKLFEVV